MPHIVNIGKMIEDMEIDLRSNMVCVVRVRVRVRLCVRATWKPCPVHMLTPPRAHTPTHTHPHPYTRTLQDNLYIKKTREIVNSMRRLSSGPTQGQNFTASLMGAVAAHGATRQVDG